jgi:hypothetical protein
MTSLVYWCTSDILEVTLSYGNGMITTLLTTDQSFIETAGVSWLLLLVSSKSS